MQLEVDLFLSVFLASPELHQKKKQIPRKAKKAKRTKKKWNKQETKKNGCSWFLQMAFGHWLSTTRCDVATNRHFRCGSARVLVQIRVFCPKRRNGLGATAR